MKMAGRLTYLPSSNLLKIFSVARAILIGAVLAVIAVLFHNSYSPFGLIIALIESALGIYFLTKHYRGIALPFIAFGAWATVIYRAGSLGVSEELLIEGNFNGNVLLIGGLILNFIAIIKGKKLS